MGCLTSGAAQTIASTESSQRGPVRNGYVPRDHQQDQRDQTPCLRLGSRQTERRPWLHPYEGCLRAYEVTIALYADAL
jgi:hypothetical protein